MRHLKDNMEGDQGTASEGSLVERKALINSTLDQHNTNRCDITYDVLRASE
jgi:hypothetical protein